MSRQFIVHGPCLVQVKGHNSFATSDRNPGIHELGLAKEDIVVSPRFRHKEIPADEFTDEIGADRQCLLADAIIRMTLIHYDPDILDKCVIEAMCSRENDFGRLPGTGTLMGRGFPLYEEGNRYISLSLFSQAGLPWRFFATYLTGMPLEMPMGSISSAVLLVWRAVPYAFPITETVTTVSSFTSQTNAPGAPVPIPANPVPGDIPAIVMGEGLTAPAFQVAGAGGSVTSISRVDSVRSQNLRIWDRSVDVA